MVLEIQQFLDPFLHHLEILQVASNRRIIRKNTLEHLHEIINKSEIDPLFTTA